MKTKIKIKDLKGPNGGIMFGTTEVMPGQYRVNTLVFHEGIHYDEALLDISLRRHAVKFFPDIDRASREFWAREKAMQANALELLKQGILLVAIGDSPFNEHETASRGEVEGQSATSLAAGLIGFLSKREVTGIINDGRMMDRYPNDYKGNTSGHMANAMKAMIKSGVPDGEVMEWAMKALDAIFLQQEGYWQGSAEAFNDVAKVCERRLGNGKMAKVAVVHADEDSFTRFAFSKQGPRADIVVAFKSTGHLYIGTRKDGVVSAEVVAEIFRLISIREMEARGQTVPKEYFKQGADLPDDVGPLHHWRENKGILNKGEPVKLTSETVVGLVKLGLGFQPQGGGRGSRGEDRQVNHCRHNRRNHSSQDRGQRQSRAAFVEGDKISLVDTAKTLGPVLDGEDPDAELLALARNAGGKRAGTTTPPPESLGSSEE